jgi:2-hydroxy-3-oxopropionate reductase
MPDKVGFIGIGQIGTPMSLNVLRGGYPLVVYDIRREQMEPLLKEGAESSTSPRDVASRCSIVLMSLPNSAIVEQVALGPDGIIEGAKPGTLVIDLTSGNPPQSAVICARLAEKSIRYIDAGVSGGIPGAEAATLGVMVGGGGEDFERARPVLEKIGTNLLHMGAIGSGHMTKALNNFLAATNLAAASEALVVATKAGLDPEKVVGAFNASSGRSRATEERIPNFVLKGDFRWRGGMAMELIVKDLATACGVGKDQGVPMFVANLMHQLLMRISDEIGPKTPNIGVARAMEQWAGVEVRSSQHTP